MKVLYFVISLSIVFITDCDSNQKQHLDGMWLIVKEDGNFVYDCHEVLFFDKDTYTVYNCDIDYSENPSEIERGEFKFENNRIQLINRSSKHDKLSFFLTDTKSLNLKVNKLSNDSLVVSYINIKETKEFKFKRIQNNLKIN